VQQQLQQAGCACLFKSGTGLTSRVRPPSRASPTDASQNRELEPAPIAEPHQTVDTHIHKLGGQRCATASESDSEAVEVCQASCSSSIVSRKAGVASSNDMGLLLQSRELMLMFELQRHTARALLLHCGMAPSLAGSTAAGVHCC
jgi:hypothetical protein